MTYGLFGIKRWKPTKSVTVPPGAKFATGDELEAERRRLAFWRAIESRKRKPLDYDLSPPPV